MKKLRVKIITGPLDTVTIYLMGSDDTLNPSSSSTYSVETMEEVKTFSSYIAAVNYAEKVTGVKL